MTLRSISAYKSLTNDRSSDLDGTQATIVHNDSQQDHEWWSQDAQFIFNSDRFNFIGGAYYFEGQNDPFEPLTVAALKTKEMELMTAIAVR